MNRREWYERVNAAWPQAVPALTGLEAVRAARRLFRFCKVKVARIVETSGNRSSWAGYDSAGLRFRVNPAGGWKLLVHSVSHWAHYRTAPGVAPHDKAHARLELRLVKQVLKRGWLEGRLKPAPQPKAAAPAPSSAGAKVDHARAMLRRAETRAKRAATILAKWKRRVARAERKAANPESKPIAAA